MNEESFIWKMENLTVRISKGKDVKEVWFEGKKHISWVPLKKIYEHEKIQKQGTTPIYNALQKAEYADLPPEKDFTEQLEKMLEEYKRKHQS